MAWADLAPAAHERAVLAIASEPRGRASAGRGRTAPATVGASVLARRPRRFFWPHAAQQVTRAIAAIPFGDVSAAAACAGAVALWALALSLLAM
jgi:hypothetical protein